MKNTTWEERFDELYPHWMREDWHGKGKVKDFIRLELERERKEGFNEGYARAKNDMARDKWEHGLI